jgi:hypothetical protein
MRIATEAKMICRKAGKYQRLSGKDKNSGRDVLLNTHVAQYSFYDVELASNHTKAGKTGPQ